MGMEVVAFRTAAVAADPVARRTSGLSRTTSAASSVSFSLPPVRAPELNEKVLPLDVTELAESFAEGLLVRSGRHAE